MVDLSSKGRLNNILPLWPYARPEEIERFFVAYGERAHECERVDELSFCGASLRFMAYRAPNLYDDLISGAEAWMAARFYKELEEVVPMANGGGHCARL